MAIRDELLEKDCPPKEKEIEDFLRKHSDLYVSGRPLDENTKNEIIYVLHRCVGSNRKTEKPPKTAH